MADDFGDEDIPRLDAKKYKSYTSEEIKQWLSVLPARIVKRGEEVSELEKEYDLLKEDIKVLKAKKHLEARNKTNAIGESMYGSNDDRKAYVASDPGVHDKEVELIEKDGELTVAKLKMQGANDQFTSARKIASLLIAEEEAYKKADKYDNPQ